MPAVLDFGRFVNPLAIGSELMASTTQRPSTLRLTIILGCLAAFGLGVRVPTWVVSPWAKAGHIERTVYDHSSTLKLIERLHAKWAATPYSSAYENAYKRTLDDPSYRDRAYEEIDSPPFWSSWSLPTLSLPAFLSGENSAVIIVFGLIAVFLGFGYYLTKTGWKPSKKVLSSDVLVKSCR
jgi:hypothetical protein